MAIGSDIRLMAGASYGAGRLFKSGISTIGNVSKSAVGLGGKDEQKKQSAMLYQIAVGVKGLLLTSRADLQSSLKEKEAARKIRRQSRMTDAEKEMEDSRKGKRGLLGNIGNRIREKGALGIGGSMLSGLIGAKDLVMAFVPGFIKWGAIVIGGLFAAAGLKKLWKMIPEEQREKMKQFGSDMWDDMKSVLYDMWTGGKKGEGNWDYGMRGYIKRGLNTTLEELDLVGEDNMFKDTKVWHVAVAAMVAKTGISLLGKWFAAQAAGKAVAVAAGATAAKVAAGTVLGATALGITVGGVVTAGLTVAALALLGGGIYMLMKKQERSSPRMSAAETAKRVKDAKLLGGHYYPVQTNPWTGNPINTGQRALEIAKFYEVGGAWWGMTGRSNLRALKIRDDKRNVAKYLNDPTSRARDKAATASEDIQFNRNLGRMAGRKAAKVKADMSNRPKDTKTDFVLPSKLTTIYDKILKDNPFLEGNVVDRNTFMKQLWVESKFKSNEEGDKNAHGVPQSFGLMQVGKLALTDANKVLLEHKKNPVDWGELKDPTQNILAGLSYQYALSTRYKRRDSLLKNYNAGPGIFKSDTEKQIKRNKNATDYALRVNKAGGEVTVGVPNVLQKFLNTSAAGRRDATAALSQAVIDSSSHHSDNSSVITYQYNTTAAAKSITWGSIDP